MGKITPADKRSVVGQRAQPGQEIESVGDQITANIPCGDGTLGLNLTCLN